MKKSDIREVYEDLKYRNINPSGSFDNGGRWYASNTELINVRSPSRAWPYSEMTACRTLKYVTAVSNKFNCQDADELREVV
jgi:hypothetical protein